MTIEEIIAQEKEREATQRYEGYTIADLRVVFNKMTDGMDNWKKPFAVSVKGEMVGPCVAAIKFFCGDCPEVRLNIRTMNYLIETRGYYEAIGA